MLPFYLYAHTYVYIKYMRVFDERMGDDINSCRKSSEYNRL
jgi:hypothetical protein